MNFGHIQLSKQLLLLVAIAFVLFFTSLGIVLPKMLMPFVESNIYYYLKEPLKYMDTDVDSKLLNTEVAYIYVTSEKVMSSSNIQDVIPDNKIKNILQNIHGAYGKFQYNHKTYYYYQMEMNQLTKIAISNDAYVKRAKASMLNTILPIILGTFLIIGLLLVLWSTLLVRKIEKLKRKIDHIDDVNYDHYIDFGTDDEMKSLAFAIEDMRLSLINQEKYRNQMYQNISHDFKTPLTVIKSYIEAVDDGVESSNTAFKVIKEQTAKLEQKVHSLLYLNKLDYLKNSKVIESVPVDMEMIIQTEIEKFKFHRKDIQFIVDIDKRSKYTGTVEHWETILDNLLSNFMRYTKSTIKITAKGGRLTLYNDGDSIEPDLLEAIFTPFRKGMKGEFGLGLSIVKKTLNLMNYDITIRNEKKGVSFLIKKM